MGSWGGSRQWAAQRAAFGSRFDIPVLDVPGYGEDAHLDAPDTILAVATWVLEELTARGVERFHLWVIGWGHGRRGDYGQVPVTLPAAAGMWLGRHLSQRVDAEVFRGIVLMLVGVLGLNLLPRATFG